MFIYESQVSILTLSTWKINSLTKLYLISRQFMASIITQTVHQQVYSSISKLTEVNFGLLSSVCYFEYGRISSHTTHLSERNKRGIYIHQLFS